MLKEEKEEQAEELARLNARLAIMKVRGEKTDDLEVELKQKELYIMLTAATKNGAAIIAKQSEIDQLIETQHKATKDKSLERMREDFENEMRLKDLQGKDTLRLRIRFQQALIELDKKDTSEAGLKRLREDIQKLREMQVELAGRGPSLGGALLQKLFGVKEEDVQRVREAINRAVTTISDSVGQLATSLLEGAMQETEQALERAQQQLQDANQKLSDAQSRAQTTAQQLNDAEGARRDYLLGKLAKERQEVGALAAAKKRAADEEERQTKRKHELEKRSAELTAASALATNVAAAASAVYAGIKAVEKGAEQAWPVSLVAIATGIAAVVTAVASAKQLSNATKMADGGIIQGGSHASGNDVPVFGGRVRVEGGEAITPVDATRNNGPLLEMLRTTGRRRALTVADLASIGRVQVAPAPKSYYADGGILSKGPEVSGGYASANDMGALAARLDRQSTLLAAILDGTTATANNTAATEQHSAATAQHTAAIRDKDPTVKWDFEAEQGRRGVETKLDQAESYLKG